MAGTVQWMPPIYWFDVLKSRMQSALPGTYSSTYDCYRQLMQKEGPKALVKGQGIAFLRAFPLHATIFFMYEVTMKFLK